MSNEAIDLVKRDVLYGIERLAGYAKASEVESTQWYNTLQGAVEKLEAENKRLRSFMQLKDNAKLKVERDRDAAKRVNAEQLEEIQSLARAVSKLESQHADNTTQAQAYQSLESELLKVRDKLRAAQHRVEQLESQRDHWESAYNHAKDVLERLSDSLRGW